MTDDEREALIERIKAVRDDGYLSATYLGNEHVGDLMGDILAVFEAAQKPTDDERKVRDFYEKHYSDSGWSVEQVDVRVFVPTTRPGNALEIIQQALDSAGLDIRAVPAGFRRPVQEPTDAQVEAAAEGLFFEHCGEAPSDEYRSSEDFNTKFREYARAALRAAAAVQEPSAEQWCGGLRICSNAEHDHQEPQGDVVGRFSFDGAEGIAFWVGNSDEEHTTKVMFSELTDLAQFLCFNFPGLFKAGSDGAHSQGEPTDAQVLVALNAWYAKEREQNGWPIGSNAAELADYSPQTQDRMRAALRAAYEEGKKR